MAPRTAATGGLHKWRREKMRRRERKKKNTLLEILSLTALLANVWVRHTSCQYICRFVCGEELVNSFSAQSQTTASQTSAATVEFNVPIQLTAIKLLHQHRGWNLCLMNEPEETQTLATDSRYVCSQTSSWEPQETHTQKKENKKKKNKAHMDSQMVWRTLSMRPGPIWQG